MKIILVGYPGSQCINKAIKYLTDKYLPEFDIKFLNYRSHISGWSSYIIDYLTLYGDENVIFGLDDYLVSDYIDALKYQEAISKIGGDVVCVKLCYSKPGEHEEYPVTTQYCIWNRKYLIWLLRQVNTPWEFEMVGSAIFDKTSLNIPCIQYYTNSAISSRWEGVKLCGLKQEDINFLKSNQYV